MKRLPLVKNPQSPVTILTEKDRLIKDIKDFIGPNGCIAFEHGYRPTYNAQMITDTEVILRFRIGKNRRSKIPLEELDEAMLKNIIIELFRYQNFCHLLA